MSGTGVWSYAAGEEWAPARLVGYQVEALDGPAGTVDESSTEAHEGCLVVSTRWWQLGRDVLVPAGLLTRADAHHRTVHVDLTRREIRKAPRFDPATCLDRACLDALRRYFGD